MFNTKVSKKEALDTTYKGLAIAGTFILSNAAKIALMTPRTKADGTTAAPIIPDNITTNLIAAGVGFAGAMFAKNEIVKLAFLTMFGFFIIRSINKFTDGLNGTDGMAGGLKDFLKKYVPNLGGVNEPYNAQPNPRYTIGDATDLPSLYDNIPAIQGLNLGADPNFSPLPAGATQAAGNLMAAYTA